MKTALLLLLLCAVVQRGSASCGSTCILKGDPHLKTFDGVHTTHMGVSNFTVLTDNKNLSVEVETRGENKAYVKSVTIRFEGNTVHLAYQPNRKNKTRPFYVNGVQYHLNVTKRGMKERKVFWDCGFAIALVGKYGKKFLSLQIPFGLSVSFDNKQFLEIMLDDWYKGKVTGLCGNYNGDKDDDLMLKDGTSPNGSMREKANQVWESWRIGAPDDTTETERESYCQTSEAKNPYAPSCAAMNGTFIACGFTSDEQKNDEFNDCLFDACMDEDICIPLEAYYSECVIDNANTFTVKNRKLFCSSLAIEDQTIKKHCDFCG